MENPIAAALAASAALLRSSGTWTVAKLIAKVLAKLLATLLATGLGGGAQAQRLPDGFFPESLTATRDGTLFAGSATQSSIVRIAPGAAAAAPFVAPGTGGLMSVQGLLADEAGGLLYACSANLGVAATALSPSALLAFDLGDGALRGRWELPAGGFCNDIARGPDGKLYLSDTARPRILQFDVRSGSLSVWLEHPMLGGAPFNGNGIVFDGDRLYLSTFSDGRLIALPMLANGKAGEPVQLRLPRPLAGADALRLLAPGRLLVFENALAGGSGRVSIVEVDGGSARLHTVAEGLAQPVSGVVSDVLSRTRLTVAESQFSKLFGTSKGEPPAPFRLRTLALPLAAAQLPSIALPDQARYPNGIAAAQDGSLYLGFISDGKLLRRGTDGQWRTVFAGSEDVFAATSLRLDAARGLLWGTSPDFLPQGRAPRPHRLFAFDLARGTVRRSMTLPDAGFGNDIALTPDGAVLLTDSLGGRVLRLAPGASEFETVTRHPLLTHAGGIGVAGIALAPDGRMVAGNFGSGRLAMIDQAAVRGIALPRLLENPDGMAFAPDGALIVLEGALDSGDGKVLRIRDPFAPGMRVIEVLAAGLDSPVNLTIAADGMAYVTESRIRHRLKGNGLAASASFRILAVPL